MRIKNKKEFDDLFPTLAAVFVDDEPKTNKHNSKKVVHDGITFPSIAEGKRYLMLSNDVNVKFLKLQPRFFFASGITYKADFDYHRIYEDGKTERIIEEVKGYATRDFIMRKKLFKHEFPTLKLHILNRKMELVEEIYGGKITKFKKK